MEFPSAILLIEDIQVATSRHNEGQLAGQRGLASLDRVCGFYPRASAVKLDSIVPAVIAMLRVSLSESSL